MALNEWLKLMLEEIHRKQREREEAEREHERRQGGAAAAPDPAARDDGTTAPR